MIILLKILSLKTSSFKQKMLIHFVSFSYLSQAPSLATPTLPCAPEILAALGSCSMVLFFMTLDWLYLWTWLIFPLLAWWTFICLFNSWWTFSESLKCLLSTFTIDERSRPAVPYLSHTLDDPNITPRGKYSFTCPNYSTTNMRHEIKGPYIKDFVSPVFCSLFDTEEATKVSVIWY